MQPRVGEKLYLHQQAPAMPRLTTAASIISFFSKSNDLAKGPDAKAKDEIYFTHTVQLKETMYSISKKYSVSPEDIVEWNGLQNMALKTGQQLRIKKI